MPQPSRIGTLLVFVVVAGCGDSSTGPTPQDPTELDFHASLGVDLDQMTLSPTGLYYRTLEEGTGVEVAGPGDEVELNYTGWLHTGAVFDQSLAGAPFQTTLGIGRLIAGFDEGVQGMRLEELRQLVIPYQLGYGNRSLGVIPPFSTLVFQIELVGLN